MHLSTCAAHGRDEAADQSEKVGSPGDAGLGEDVIAVRPSRRLGDAERSRGLVEASTGNELLKQPRLCRRQAEDPRHGADLGRQLGTRGRHEYRRGSRCMLAVASKRQDMRGRGSKMLVDERHTDA